MSPDLVGALFFDTAWRLQLARQCVSEETILVYGDGAHRKPPRRLMAPTQLGVGAFFYSGNTMSRAILAIYVAIGGAFGSIARYALSLFVQSRTSSPFPTGTLLVNITGSILLGFLMRYGLESASASPEVRLLLTTGFCGGYTTFSTFSYETARLFEDGEWSRGGTYIVASVVLSLVGTFVGFALARALLAAQRA